MGNVEGNLFRGNNLWQWPQILPLDWKIFMRLLTICGLVLVAPGAAMAAGNEIIVTGFGLPTSPGAKAYGVITLDRDELLNSASGRIEDVLTGVAGFQQFRRSDSRSANPTAQGVTLRALGGNAASRALMILDGVPLADPFFGHVAFSALTPERLSNIRITRGGGAGAFGAGALAGTIELASAGRDDLPFMTASALYGNRDAAEVTASLTPDLGGGFVSISGRFDRGDGFHTTPREQRVPVTARAAYKSWSGNARAVVPVNDTLELQARFGLFRDWRTLRFEGADNYTEGQDASIRLISRGNWKFDALAYVQARDFSNIVISSSNFGKVLDQRKTPATGIGGKIEIRPPLGDSHILRIGADIRRNSGTMFEESYNAGTGAITARRDAGGQSLSLGMFVEDDWTLGNVVLTGGARLDHWRIAGGSFRERDAMGATRTDDHFADRSDWRLNGRVGVAWNATDAIVVRAAAYTGFRMPTLNELYRPFTVFPITTRANAALKPERLKGVEAGIDFMPLRNFGLGVTLFHNKLEDAIANVTLSPTLRQRRNVDAIKAAGMEATGQAQLGDFSLSVTYAYSNSEMQGSGPSAGLDGFIPAQSPRHAASASIAWAPAKGPQLVLAGRYVGAQYEDDRESDALPDAFTLDAVGSLPLGHGLELMVRGENLFDKDVITRNAGGAIDLGTPRTLWVGLRFGG